jgi:hypothetical protein
MTWSYSLNGRISLLGVVLVGLIFVAFRFARAETFGRGRTFAMATDSTYAWGTDFEKSRGEADNRYFRKFWRNVVHWLTENCTGANRRLIVETDKILYKPLIFATRDRTRLCSISLRRPRADA